MQTFSAETVTLLCCRPEWRADTAPDSPFETAPPWNICVLTPRSLSSTTNLPVQTYFPFITSGLMEQTNASVSEAVPADTACHADEDYADGAWHAWSTDECGRDRGGQVPASTELECRLSNGPTSIRCLASAVLRRRIHIRLWHYADVLLENHAS